MVSVVDPIATDLPRLAKILQPLLASPLYRIDVTVNNKPITFGKASENHTMITEAIADFLSSRS